MPLHAASWRKLAAGSLCSTGSDDLCNGEAGKQVSEEITASMGNLHEEREQLHRELMRLNEETAKTKSEVRAPKEIAPDLRCTQLAMYQKLHAVNKTIQQ